MLMFLGACIRAISSQKSKVVQPGVTAAESFGAAHAGTFNVRSMP